MFQCCCILSLLQSANNFQTDYVNSQVHAEVGREEGRREREEGRREREEGRREREGGEGEREGEKEVGEGEGISKRMERKIVSYYHASMFSLQPATNVDLFSHVS